MCNRLIAVILAASLIIANFSGCSSQKGSEPKATTEPETVTEPEMTVTVVDAPTELTEQEKVMREEADGSISSLVYSAVSYDLQSQGYNTHESVAFSNDQKFMASGLEYQVADFDFFSDPEYEAHGFVSVIGPDDEYQKIPENADYIAVEPINGQFTNSATYNLVAYNCDSISSGHFIYEDKYVMYYQLDDSTVKYETLENKKENYNLDLGTLYDYDRDLIIYDASLFGEYQSHSGTQLFAEEDYDELQKQMRELSKAQEEKGYYVEELNIVYISPESVEAYLASQEEDTFFGYSVTDLEQAFGEGIALRYTENGFEPADYYKAHPDEYNWKGFLTKAGIGTGIILVGAILTPITGGASFGCALVTISTITLSASFVEGVGTLAIETASGMLQGKNFEDALRDASHAGLDAFANTFLITAAITTVGVTTGVIKPIACFTAGTLVAVPSSMGVEYKAIESIRAGDAVFSYDEKTDSVDVNIVSETFVNTTDAVTTVVLEKDSINSTPSHPYFVPTYDAWICAENLRPGMKVLLLDGTYSTVKSICTSECADTQVYNFTVANDHNYFVGQNSVLVHNTCKTLDARRRKAVQDAWKKELEDIQNGTSRYNWTDDEIAELLQRCADGKPLGIKGYEGCHIKDVNLCKDLADRADNIIFLKHDVHIQLVHGGNTKNPSHWGEIIKIMPQFEEQIRAIGGLT